MTKRWLLAMGFLGAIHSIPSNAVYFPGGIDWANPSPKQFVSSIYLNALGRAPQDNELRAASRFLSRSDTSQTRLDFFNKVLETSEYRQIFGVQDKTWRVYRAPDLNYGRGFWRYRAANSKPSDFERWRLSSKSSESVAVSMAHYYETYCYQSTPCITDPARAFKRGTELTSTYSPQPAHACSDASNLVGQFEWIGLNGTTYPQGTNRTTLCMGNYYYEAKGVVLHRFQCDHGYLNCRRDKARDIRGQRLGRDTNGKPTLFFADGTRLILASHSPNPDQGQPDYQNQTYQNEGTDPLPVDKLAHGCADPSQTNSIFRWNSSNGTTNSAGIGTNTICMDNHFYKVAGTILERFDCAPGFRDCIATPAKNITAKKRTTVNGFPGLEFHNGTTLALIKNPKPLAHSTTTTSPLTTETATPRLPGQHECGVPAQRTSQFRWTQKSGQLSWPDGVAGRFVCLRDSYFQIQGATLRHHQCDASFRNCRENRRKDLIAVRNTIDENGHQTLVFANGDKLSLISR